MAKPETVQLAVKTGQTIALLDFDRAKLPAQISVVRAPSNKRPSGVMLLNIGDAIDLSRPDFKNNWRIWLNPADDAVRALMAAKNGKE